MAATGLDLRDPGRPTAPPAARPTELRMFLNNQLNSINSTIRAGFQPPISEATRMNREIALAVANWDCNESINYETRRLDIQLGLEQDFVDRHESELEQWAIEMENRRVQDN
jgi:hypothetical protein